MALGAMAISVEHVGSTSVPGVAAKPLFVMSVRARGVDVMGSFTDRVQDVRHVLESVPGGRHLVVGDLRVQRIARKGGWRSWTIVWPEGTLHAEADRFLRVHDGSGHAEDVRVLPGDHLRWLERECLAFDTVQLRDLERSRKPTDHNARWRPRGQPGTGSARRCRRPAP